MSTRSVVHPFAPVSNAHSRILILGTMPSVGSREAGFYYGHPRNRFWSVLAECFGKSLPQTVEEKTRLLLDHNIALWDVLASCNISSSDDASIRESVPNDIVNFMGGKQIHKILCNGKKAYQLYNRFFNFPLPALPMPSTSSANAAWRLDRLIDAWKPELKIDIT